MLNSFSISDFVGVVSFSSEANILYGDKIKRATDELKGNLTEKIDALSAKGQTNFEAAFKKAFEMLDHA